MDQNRLRAWWWHRQGLDGSMQGASPASVLERSGWARSVGGVGPYVTLFARAGTGREAADAAVRALEIHELPSARRCTYVLPAGDFALGLRLGQGPHPEMRVAAKLGVTEKEIDTLCRAVLKALAGMELEPEQIRAATGKAARSLGEEGKKKGLTTTLPIALGRLQSEGAIRRVPVNGRLDQQRYKYVLWSPGPLEGYRRSQEEAFVDLARRWFSWTGPATPAEFQWFSGLGVKAAQTAMEPLGLVAMEKGSDRLMHPADREMLEKFKPPREPQIALLSCTDALFLLRRDIAGLVDEDDRKRKVPDGRKLVGINGLVDLPSHAIVDRGRLIGLWEYDHGEAAIVWMAWARPKEAAQAVRVTEAYVRDQLGDARSFSLDSPKSRAPRIAALRAT